MEYFDCSMCPERLIFDFLWLDGGKYLADSFEATNPFAHRWTYAESTEPDKWCHLTHVDIWSVAQVVQRRGVDAELALLEMAQRDSARRVWPVSMVRHPVPNVASSDAVQKVLNQYPWVDSGLQWKGTMVFVEKPGEDRSTLFDSAKKPGVDPRSGPSSSGQDASSSTAPPAKSPSSALTETATSGKAASPGRPASESAATGKTEGSSVPKAPAPSSKAVSDSGVTDSTKSQEKSTASTAQVGKASSTSAPSTSLPQTAIGTAGPTSVSASQSRPASESGSMPAPVAKSKATSETGKAPSAAGAPSGTASQSSVTASSGFPTIAESLGQKRSPPLKAAPSSKSTTTPAPQTEKSQVAAAKGPPPATSQQKTGMSSRSPAASTASKTQEDSGPQRAQRAPAAPVAIEKDAAMSYTEQVMQHAKPEDKKVIPPLEPISYLSDANKIAWVRAFLGWAYKAVMIQDVDPRVDMCEHTGMVHFLQEMYTRITVKGAKPLSEIGQGPRDSSLCRWTRDPDREGRAYDF